MQGYNKLACLHVQYFCYAMQVYKKALIHYVTQIEFCFLQKLRNRYRVEELLTKSVCVTYSPNIYFRLIIIRMRYEFMQSPSIKGESFLACHHVVGGIKLGGLACHEDQGPPLSFLVGRQLQRINDLTFFFATENLSSLRENIVPTVLLGSL